ncbi:retrovirus-related Pol polyprotein from transposon 17.6 [Trichonephila clavata]|uniref:RNA-directed DNA polymerase n=1 Tax=Trichonephila clavata TaxID=2740835 RepID=A0A8X6KTS4_TRICU|nr:retrovirus-related Pol polyprotein from transposon 17.6 [Trichonephila clavata]
METVLNGLTPEACLVYLDDIIIVGKSFEEHLSNLRRVFEKLKEAKLKLNPSKCNLFRHEVNYLGHIISADGVRTDPQKVSAVKDWRRPKNVHELRSFLGLCTYYRRFVKGFSSIARPLHRLTENKQKFLWTDECEEAFNSLKAALTSSPILVYPDPEKQFILDTDASHESVGAVLSQEINGQEHVIAYWSKCLSKPERNYCVTRKELLAIVKAVENFHSYLYGRKFLLRTDHASLTWLLNFKNTEGQIARWIQKLEEYDFEIKHRKGSLHENHASRIYFGWNIGSRRYAKLGNQWDTTAAGCLARCKCLSRRRRLPRVFPHFRDQPCFALPRPRLRSVNAFFVAPTRRGVRFRPTTVAGCSSCFAPLKRPSWYQVPEPAAPLVMVRIVIATTRHLSLKFKELMLNKYIVSTVYEKSYFTDVQK